MDDAAALKLLELSKLLLRDLPARESLQLESGRDGSQPARRATEARPDRFLVAELLATADVVIERLPLNQLAHQVRLAVACPIGPDDANDVGMVDETQEPDLALERVLGASGDEDLESSGYALELVAHAVDTRESTIAEMRLDLEAVVDHVSDVVEPDHRELPFAAGLATPLLARLRFLRRARKSGAVTNSSAPPSRMKLNAVFPNSAWPIRFCCSFTRRRHSSARRAAHSMSSSAIWHLGIGIEELQQPVDRLVHGRRCHGRSARRRTAIRPGPTRRGSRTAAESSTRR